LRGSISRWEILEVIGFSIDGATPIAGWFIVENPIEMDDLGVSQFQETPKPQAEVLILDKNL